MHSNSRVNQFLLYDVITLPVNMPSSFFFLNSPCMIQDGSNIFKGSHTLHPSPSPTQSKLVIALQVGTHSSLLSITITIHSWNQFLLPLLKFWLNILYVSKGYESLYFTLIKNWSIYILVKNKKQGDLTKELGRSNYPLGIVDNNTQLHHHFWIQSPLPSRQLFEVSRTFPRRIYPAWARGVL